MTICERAINVHCTFLPTFSVPHTPPSPKRNLVSILSNIRQRSTRAPSSYRSICLVKKRLSDLHDVHQVAVSVEAPTVGQMLSSNMRTARLLLEIHLVPGLCGWNPDGMQYQFPSMPQFPVFPVVPQPSCPIRETAVPPMTEFDMYPPFPMPNPPNVFPQPTNFPIISPTPTRPSSNKTSGSYDPLRRLLLEPFRNPRGYLTSLS